MVGVRIVVENEKLVNIPPKDPMDFCGVVCNYAEELIEKAKSEAYKEFAERLLQKKYQSSDWSHGEHPFVVEVDDILDVLEEMG